jgi:hypothetical protein
MWARLVSTPTPTAEGLPGMQKPQVEQGEIIMPLTYGTKGGEDFKRVPSGSHVAICNCVADLGVQPGSGMYPAPKRQVFIRWEVPEERVEYERDGKKLEGPIVIGKTYTASMSEKANLRKDLENWRGRSFSDDEAASFDVSSILGKPCMLGVVESTKGDKTYSNIKSVGALPKGFKAGQSENPLLYYAPGDEESYDKLPEWIRKKIDGQIKEETRQVEYDNDPGYDSDPTAREDGFQATDEDVPF